MLSGVKLGPAAYTNDDTVDKHYIDPTVLPTALAARASQLFNTAAEWPTEVRQPLLATVVTNAVVRDAIEVVVGLTPLLLRAKCSPCVAVGGRLRG